MGPDNVRRLVTHDASRSPAQQLATDEAALNIADEGDRFGKYVLGSSFRIWQFRDPVVVLGRSSRFDDETNSSYCESNSIPILRRCSGGASVVGGPGCLMYSLVLSLAEHPSLRKIDAAHDFVMDRVLSAIRRQNDQVVRRGICDLTVSERKFSGNSLRITRGHLLYHGTILHDADLDLVSSCLAFAPRQPDYRQGREHRDFITNLSCEADQLAVDLCDVFEATEHSSWNQNQFPVELHQEIDRLVEHRYSTDAWHRRH